jgi:Ser/Thr protein kinase RdoA (MazF antagonist)
MLENILSAFGISKEYTEVIPFGTGLINNTWHIKSNGSSYILQRINQHVFKNPEDIAFNIKSIADYFAKTHPDYFFVTPKRTVLNGEMTYLPEEGYFRLFPFVKKSHSIDVVHTTDQAYEAARQFGRFTKLLANFPSDELKITMPDFHNLTLRYQQFLTALETGNKERIKECTELIQSIMDMVDIVHEFDRLKLNPDFKLRVTHHDTKISNVLFDENDKGLCVIDLDTVMPGYFISDVGDMLRTYLSPVSEEEKGFNKIEIRDDYFKAIAAGYLSEMQDELTETEKKHFIYAGKFMIYMQAIRFLADYICDDIYYGSKYPGHNLVRANNQIVLLQKLIDYE